MGSRSHQYVLPFSSIASRMSRWAQGSLRGFRRFSKRADPLQQFPDRRAGRRAPRIPFQRRRRNSANCFDKTTQAFHACRSDRLAQNLLLRSARFCASAPSCLYDAQALCLRTDEAHLPHDLIRAARFVRRIAARASEKTTRAWPRRRSAAHRVRNRAASKAADVAASTRAVRARAERHGAFPALLRGLQ